MKIQQQSQRRVTSSERNYFDKFNDGLSNLVVYFVFILTTILIIYCGIMSIVFILNLELLKTLLCGVIMLLFIFIQSIVR